MTDESLTILVTGGTGTLGQTFSDLAIRRGHRVRIMSRRAAPPRLEDGREWARADLETGDGLEDAVQGADVVLHAASDPRGDAEAVDVDVDGTRRLLDALRKEGVRHLVYPSIVGIDRIPFSYYDAKQRAEALVSDSGIPHTTVRITQFHSFVDQILSTIGKLPIMPLPTRARIQSIDVREAAAHLLERTEAQPAGATPDVAGPEVLTLDEMARTWCRLRSKKRWIVRLPVPGRMARGLREGRVTAPDRAVGTVTWEAWLRQGSGARAPEPAGSV